jgi:adenylosuccinate lyase
MHSDSLNNISPIDGRYQQATSSLQKYFSEAALIRYRVYVEIQYFVAFINKNFLN